MSGFDTIAIVDWSGGNDRGAKPTADAIWIGIHRDDGSAEQLYQRNRQVAEETLTDLIKAERTKGNRLLIGFDFPFGYPAGFGRALTGSDDPLAVLEWFKTRIKDTPKANNRIDIAGEINRALGGGTGPFWANGFARDVDGLPRTQKGYANPFPSRRTCEGLAKGAFTCWQLFGAGSVGSQAMTGLPVLARLRNMGARVWPFEPLDSDVALVEVWPSLTVGAAPEGMIKDQWQVAEVARQLSALSQADMAEMLGVETTSEGWIFGLGYEDRLNSAPPPLRNDCFALPPGVHWTPVDKALALLQKRLSAVTAEETLPVHAALGRICARDVNALRANPPLPNTAVDGYGFAGGFGPGAHAVPLADTRAAAGDAPGALPAGHAMRVLTGAALPQGVDTVILQEDVQIKGGTVHFNGPLKQGSNTRKAGEDKTAGELICAAWRRISAADLALLAATGTSEVTVRKPLRVGVLSTGDELVEAGATARDGQIFDANRPMLLGLVGQMGHRAVDLGIAGDDRAGLREVLDAAAAGVDVIVTSGGASAGDEDHVSALLEEAGAMALWRIAIKPGRPLALGLWRGVPVFGLPGNPVAAMVCTLIFAKPAMDLLAGAGWSEPQGFDVPAAFEKRKKAGRREYLRARIRGGKAEVFPSEGSGRISGLAWAEGLVELPDGAGQVMPGDRVRFIPFGSFGV